MSRDYLDDPAVQERLADLNRRMEERREREGFSLCPACGCQHTEKTLTCRECGAKAGQIQEYQAAPRNPAHTETLEVPHDKFVAVSNGRSNTWHIAAVPARYVTLCGLTIGSWCRPRVRLLPREETCKKCRRAMEKEQDAN